MKTLLESDNLIYVKPSLELINDYLVMVNDIDVQKFISKKVKTYSYEDECEWLKEKLNCDSIIFSVLEKNSKEFVGNIEFFDKKEIGICITPKFQNMHYGTEMMKTMIDYVFNILDFDEINLKVFSNNERAIHCYKKLGFKEYVTGENTEEIFMKLLK